MPEGYCPPIAKEIPLSTVTLDLAEIQRLETAHQPSLYAKRDIALVRGEGAYLYDTDGKRYLDAMSNYGVAVLGHADAEYAAALYDQLQTLATCHQSFYNDLRAEALAEIATIAPEGSARCGVVAPHSHHRLAHRLPSPAHRERGWG